jgi:hypothetical protein
LPPPDTGTDLGQSSIQEINSVESQYSQSSEGQLRKPTNVVKVDVTATYCFGDDTVNARSDDLLALQAEKQLESDLSGTAEVKSCPVEKSDLKSGSSVSPLEENQQHLRTIEQFLELDFVNFGELAPFLRKYKPSPERSRWLSDFFHKVNLGGNKSKLYEEQCRQAAQCVLLHDHMVSEFGEECLKKPRQAYVSKPNSLGQCRRTSGPSHVEDGGGVALEPVPLCCEKPLGPSRYTGDATQRKSKKVKGMDRSSPIQISVSRAGSDSHNVGTDPERAIFFLD